MPTKPLVWIATPRKETVPDGPQTLEALLKPLAPHYANPIRELSKWEGCPWDLRIIVVGGGGIYAARNRTATEFCQQAQNEDDQLLFWDYDLMPSAQDLIKILCWDADIIGALYTTRADNGHWVMNRLPGEVPNEKGILKVMELGTGLKKFRKRVFTQALKDNPWLDCESDADHSKRFYSFFSMGPVRDDQLWPHKHRGLTEDYWFDWITRSSGIPTYVDTNIKLRHKDDHTGKVYPAVFPPDPGLLPMEARE